MLREIRIPVDSYAMTGITMVKTAHNVMFNRLLTLFLTHRLLLGLDLISSASSTLQRLIISLLTRPA